MYDSRYHIQYSDLATGWKIRGSYTSKGNRIFTSGNCRDALWATPKLCSRCKSTTVLKLSESISRWAVDLSRDYYVLDTRGKRMQFNWILFIEVSLLNNPFSPSLTLHIQNVCLWLQCRNPYLFVRFLCTLISRAAPKPYSVAPIQVHYYLLCEKKR